MNDPKLIHRVKLGAMHHPTHRTHHYHGRGELPVPSELRIVQYAGDSGFYLFYWGRQRGRESFHNCLPNRLVKRLPTPFSSWVFFFQGKRYDSATGLYASRERDYSPALGRFAENDPIGFWSGDTNFYRYVANDPTAYADPSGLAHAHDDLAMLATPVPGGAFGPTSNAGAWGGAVEGGFFVGGLGAIGGGALGLLPGYIIGGVAGIILGGIDGYQGGQGQTDFLNGANAAFRRKFTALADDAFIASALGGAGGELLEETVPALLGGGKPLPPEIAPGGLPAAPRPGPKPVEPPPAQPAPAPKPAKPAPLLPKPPTLPPDPATSPGPGWEWRGKGPVGGKDGGWFNPETGETLHPNLDHPPPIGPHWDWRDKCGKFWRVFPDGHIEPRD